MAIKYRSAILLAALMLGLVVTSQKLRADSGTCGGVTTTLPFTDVGSSIFFCQIAEAYFSGLTNGTSSTTYSPTDPVTREQMAAFITRTQDSALRRGDRRAALGQWSTPSSVPTTALTLVSSGPEGVQSDGTDLWVANFNANQVNRMRASDGTFLGSAGFPASPVSVLVARGRVYVTGNTSPGKVYVTTAGGGSFTTLATVGNGANGITTDGTFIWTANSASVSRVDAEMGTVMTFTTGLTSPFGMVFDGSNVWATDQGDSKLKKLNSSGAVIQSVTVGANPEYPVFDGTNIWVPNFGDSSVTVIRASTGVVLATLTGNGLSSPITAAFDGQRILVTNSGNNSISLWKAADLTPLGSFATGSSTGPFGACSDGINFWITLNSSNQLARF